MRPVDYMTRLWRFLGVLLPLVIRIAYCQDPSVFGVYAENVGYNPDGSEVMSARQKGLISSRCFQGLGFITCVPTLPSDDTELSYELDYYKSLAGIRGGNYCLQCCGYSPTNIDTWELTCPVLPSEVTQYNHYGWELRMAQKKTPTDLNYVVCPLKRRACDYDSNDKLIGCPRKSTDNTTIIAVTVTLTVNQYNKEFVYWNGVSKCDIQVTESDVPYLELGSGGTQYFNYRETIILNHQPLPPLALAVDVTKILVIAIVVFAAVFLLLYFCRRKHCPYCQKKLLISLDLCVYCQLVGAEKPDPVLMKALEEKTMHGQGTMPERFPGARILVGIVRPIIKLICCVRPHRVVKVVPIVEAATVAESVEDGMSVEFAGVERQSIVEESSLVANMSQEGRKRDKHRHKSILKNATPLPVADPVRLKGGKKEKPRNPNILDYPDEVIYKGVQHPFASAKYAVKH